MSELSRITGFLRPIQLVASLGLLLSGSSAFAAEEGGEHADLAAASQNPIASLISVPFENDTYFNIGDYNRTQNVLLLKPVYPFKLCNEWSLVTRTIAPFLLPQPIATQPSGTKSGLGDINPQFYFVAPPEGDWMVGFGPQFSLPTATDTILGTKLSGHPC